MTYWAFRLSQLEEGGALAVDSWWGNSQRLDVAAQDLEEARQSVSRIWPALVEARWAEARARDDRDGYRAFLAEFGPVRDVDAELRRLDEADLVATGDIDAILRYAESRGASELLGRRAAELLAAEAAPPPEHVSRFLDLFGAVESLQIERASIAQRARQTLLQQALELEGLARVRRLAEVRRLLGGAPEAAEAVRQMQETAGRLRGIDAVRAWGEVARAEGAASERASADANAWRIVSTSSERERAGMVRAYTQSFPDGVHGDDARRIERDLAFREAVASGGDAIYVVWQRYPDLEEAAVRGALVAEIERGWREVPMRAFERFEEAFPRAPELAQVRRRRGDRERLERQLEAQAEREERRERERARREEARYRRSRPPRSVGRPSASSLCERCRAAWRQVCVRQGIAGNFLCDQMIQSNCAGDCM